MIASSLERVLQNELTKLRAQARAVRLAGNFGANLEISDFRQQSESAWLFLSYRNYKNAFISGK